jgi:hypothetical protein
MVFPDSAVAGSRVSLMAGAADPDGDSLHVEWIVEAGQLVAGALWEPPDTEGEYMAEVRVTDPAGAMTREQVSVQVLPPVQPNERPVVLKIEADDDVIPPQWSTNLRVSAEDPDGDPVEIRWAATGGRVLPQGDTATWLGPAEQGSYTLSVAVTDVHGVSVAASTVIRVHVDNGPPEIISVEPSADVVRLGHAVTLIALATDPDDEDDLLSYSWTAAGGEFRGEGHEVEWIAPEGPACCAIGFYEIQVVVVDPRGGASRGAVRVRVIQ